MELISECTTNGPIMGFRPAWRRGQTGGRHWIKQPWAVASEERGGSAYQAWPRAAQL